MKFKTNQLLKLALYDCCSFYSSFESHSPKLRLIVMHQDNSCIIHMCSLNTNCICLTYAKLIKMYIWYITWTYKFFTQLIILLNFKIY